MERPTVKEKDKRQHKKNGDAILQFPGSSDAGYFRKRSSKARLKHVF